MLTHPPKLLCLLFTIILTVACTVTTEPENTPSSNTPVDTEGALTTATDPVSETWYVAAKQVDCEGVAPQKCLLIKKSPDAEYTYFYDTIEGFDWQEGIEYELRVNIISVDNPPADASSQRVTLVEIVSKTQGALPEMTETSLAGTSWQLLTIDGVAVQNKIDLQFDADRMSGSDGCNQYSGAYTIDGNQIIVGGDGFISTLIGCPPEIMAEADPYLAALRTISTYALLDGNLILQTDNGELVYRDPSTKDSAETATLQGTSWTLVSINSAPVQNNITLQFDVERISGSDGCNQYSGGYTADDSQLAVEPNLISTKKGCSAEIMDEANTYTAALLTTSGYTLSESELILQTSAGALVYQVPYGENVSAEPATLEGVRWTLVNTIVGGDAVVTTAIDDTIFMQLDAGAMSGSAGCNNMNSGYTLDGDQLTFDLIATTRKLCEDERNQRESAILELLGNVASYQITGQQLQLFNADGLILANFTSG